MPSLIAALSMNTVPRVDPNQFKIDPDSRKLDLVLNAETPGGSGGRQNSVRKIASYKPDQLKSLSADIQISTTRRKQAAQVRSAGDTLIKEKVQEVRSQNPFAEAGSGGKVNISA